MSVASPTETVTVTVPQPPAPKSHLWAGTGLAFSDVLDAINPLQHLPLIGTIYRAVTGDTIGNVARVVGDGLYGGLIGLASGVIDVASIEATGMDIGQHIVATLEDIGGSSSPAKPAAVKPAAVQPGLPPAVPTAAMLRPDDQPKLPLLGSATTAGELAAAAPISPLLAPRLVAQARAQAQASTPPAGPAPGAIAPLPGAPRGIAIDVSDQGIARMRAGSAAHNAQPVALTLPPGAFAAATATAQPAQVPAADFAARMREGLAKYDALMAARSSADAPAAGDPLPGRVDQLH